VNVDVNDPVIAAVHVHGNATVGVIGGVYTVVTLPGLKRHLCPRLHTQA
jgi:hypothetical protein